MQRYVDLIQQNKTEVRHLSYYLVFGLMALLVEMAIFYGTIHLLGLGIVLSNLIAVGCGALISFSANAFLNFGTRDKFLKRFISYGLIISAGYMFGTVIILTLAANGLDPVKAKTISLPFVFVFQYSLNRLVTFKK